MTSVHVNHLNRAAKTVTGKTTTKHINDRIINKAKTLLKNTDWNASEIAYSLGYEYPTYFTTFEINDVRGGLAKSEVILSRTF